MTQQRLTWGCRIIWKCERWRGTNKRAKKGTYRGACRHTSKHWDKPESTQRVFVHFDGNKHRSLVPLHEIEVLSP